MRRVRALTFLPVVAAALLAVPAAAGAATGTLTYKGCISGEQHLVLPPPFCSEIPTAMPDGTGSGLNAVESVTVSPDAKWVYAVARQDDSIARFKRDGHTGKLTYRDCIAGSPLPDETSCTEIPTATNDGAGSGLDDVRALVVSRDGASAYAVVAGDDAVARFKRDPRNGKLTFKDCITGAVESGPVGSGACKAIPHASSQGADSGLDHPKSITLSPDQKSLYVASTLDASVARFKRDTRSGKLTYRGCITGEQATGPVAGTHACQQTRTATGNLAGSHSGLDDARGLKVSRDGRWLYGVADDDASVFRFKRDTKSGKLTYRGCISGDLQSSGGPGCAALSTATVGGAESGLDDTRSLALSRDGRSLYTASRSDAAIARFKRDPDNGKLTFRDCITGSVAAASSGACTALGTATANIFGDDSGLGSPESIALTRDGRSLYVSTADDAGVAHFSRDTHTGKLAFIDCLGGDMGAAGCADISTATANGTDSGLEFPQFTALSPDDKSLYVAIGDDDAVATFKRAK